MTEATAEAGNAAQAAVSSPETNSPAQTTSAPAQAEAPMTPTDARRAAYDEAMRELSTPKRGRPTNEEREAREAESEDSDSTAIDEASANPEANTAAEETKKVETLKPHPNWTADEKATFEKLPVEAQKAMLAQHSNWEKGYQAKFEALAEARKFAEETDKLFTPEVRAQMQQRGITKAQAITELANFAKRLDSDPINSIAHLIKRHNVDPKVFLPQQSNTQAEATATPTANEEVQRLAPILNPLFAKIAELEQSQKAWRDFQQAEQEKSTASSIEAFVAEKDATGAPKFPYFDRVFEAMAAMIENDPRYASMEPRQRLEHAYQTAVFSDPAIRDELISAEVSKRASAVEKSTAANRLKEAATAKPTANAAGQRTGKLTRRQAYEEAMREVGRS